jgi:glycosyltransferase involved in cell wall biosynthesis
MLCQTFGDWELLAIDDHSSDASVDIVRAVAKRDLRVRLVENSASPGIVGSLRTGCQAATADWFARMDADDRSAPERLLRQWESKEHADVVATNVDLLDPLGNGMVRYVCWTNSLVCQASISNSRFIENPIIHPTVLMRRSALEAAGGYRDVPWAEDHDLWLRMLQQGARFAKVAEPLLAWRDSTGRLTRRDPRYGEKSRQRMRAHFGTWFFRCPPAPPRRNHPWGESLRARPLRQSLARCRAAVRRWPSRSARRDPAARSSRGLSGRSRSLVRVLNGEPSRTLEAPCGIGMAASAVRWDTLSPWRIKNPRDA